MDTGTNAYLVDMDPIYSKYISNKLVQDLINDISLYEMITNILASEPFNREENLMNVIYDILSQKDLLEGDGVHLDVVNEFIYDLATDVDLYLERTIGYGHYCLVDWVDYRTALVVNIYV